MRASALVVLGVGAAHSGAWADGVQAQCGSEIGIAYAAEQGIVPKGQGGWSDDKTTGGETVIRIDLDTLKVDVRFKDSTKIWQSVDDQGGKATLWGVQDSPASFMVVVGYPGSTIEVLTLAEITPTTAKMIHTVSRNLDTLTNSRVMVADCVLSKF